MYTGFSARVSLGGRGLTGRRNPQTRDATSLIQAEEIMYDGSMISKGPGTTPYAASIGATKVWNLQEFWPSPSEQFLVAVTSDGRVVRGTFGSGSFPTTMGSGMTFPHPVHFVECGKEAVALPKKMFLFSGFEPVKVISGSNPTLTNLATPPADWSGNNQPLFGVMHRSRVWAGGNANDPHRLYYNDPTNHEVFTGTPTGTMSVYPGQGTNLIGGASFATKLIIFKQPIGIYLIDDSSLDKTEWFPIQLTAAIGLGNPNLFAMTEDDLVFQSTDGLLYTLSSVDTPTGIQPRALTDDEDLDEWFRSNVDLGRLMFAHMKFHPRKRRVIWVGSTPGQHRNNMRVDYDLQSTVPRFSYSHRDMVESLCMVRQSNGVYKMLTGDDAGVVWDAEETNANKNGAPYMSRFQLADTDFSWLNADLADLRKRFQFLIVHFNPIGGGVISFDILLDGAYSQTVLVPMGSVGSMLDSFVLGTDRLGGEVSATRRKRVRGSAFTLGVIGYNGELNQRFELTQLVWQFRVGSRKERRRV